MFFSKSLQNRGFTLIELLVVISIIGVLSSVTLAAVAQAREKAQNAARVEAVRQIDLALRMYELDNETMPLLEDTCGFDFFDEDSPGECIAVQTAEDGTTEKNAWNRLQTELSPYMARLPVDPCGTNCVGVTGYTYVAPAAVYYHCYQTGDCNPAEVTESDYMNYVVKKGDTSPTGYSTVDSFFTPNSPQSSAN